MTLNSALVSATHHLDDVDDADAETLISLAVGLTEAKRAKHASGAAAAEGTPAAAAAALPTISADWSTAERLLRRALAIQEKTLGPQGIEIADTLYSVGVCMRRKSEGDGGDGGGDGREGDEGGGGAREAEIESLFRRALEIYEMHEDGDGDGDGDNSGSGSAVSSDGRRQQSSLVGVKSLDEGDGTASGDSETEMLFESAGDDDTIRRGDDKTTPVALAPASGVSSSKTRDNARVAAAAHELGMCVLGRAGKQEEALRLLKRALHIREAMLGPDDIQVRCTFTPLVRE